MPLDLLIELGAMAVLGSVPALPSPPPDSECLLNFLAHVLHATVLCRYASRAPLTAVPAPSLTARAGACSRANSHGSTNPDGDAT